jgi:arginine exporter protein ArgO
MSPPRSKSASPTDTQRKSYYALGVVVLCVMFFLETFTANYARPNPASPYVWAVLGVTAAIALVQYFRYRSAARAEISADKDK